MLDFAARRCKTVSDEAGGKISFEKGDIRNINISRKFDAVISLFHVISYQTTNEDLVSTFKTVKKHLKKDGVFLFDCWYGPCVLTDRPEPRSKQITENNICITRDARPRIYPNRNIVDVNYHFTVQHAESNEVEEYDECHSMRYLFLPEIEMLLSSAGMKLLECKEWITMNEPGTDTWAVCCVAR